MANSDTDVEAALRLARAQIDQIQREMCELSDLLVSAATRGKPLREHGELVRAAVSRALAAPFPPILEFAQVLCDIERMRRLDAQSESAARPSPPPQPTPSRY